jgi:hypothetical protein
MDRSKLIFSVFTSIDQNVTFYYHVIQLYDSYIRIQQIARGNYHAYIKLITLVTGRRGLKTLGQSLRIDKFQCSREANWPRSLGRAPLYVAKVNHIDSERNYYYYTTYLGTDGVENQRVHGGHIEVKDGEMECLKTDNNL